MLQVLLEDEPGSVLGTALESQELICKEECYKLCNIIDKTEQALQVIVIKRSVFSKRLH